MTQRPGEAGLVRALGVVGLAASVVNITIGGGIFRAPGAVEVTGRLGAAAPLAYILCAVAMAFVVMCFAEAGARVSLTGGVYAYVERAFGQFAGFFIGWMVWVTGTIATGAVGTIFVDSLLQLTPGLPAMPFRGLSLLTVFAIVATINVLGVKFGVRLNVASTIVKLTPLALLIVAGFFFVEPANLEWSGGMPAGSDLARASIVLLFVFAGIESALVPSGEVLDPARTVPRAVFIALIVCTVFYMLVHIVAQGVLGSALPGNPSPLAATAGRIAGPTGAAAMNVAVVLSTFGYLCGMTLAIPRALFAFARDGMLPRALAAVHPRYHTPWIAIIVQTALALALALSATWEKLVILANVAVLTVYLGCAAAAWQLRRKGIRDEGATMAKPIPGSNVAVPLAVIVIVVMLSTVTAREWLASGVTALVGVAIYWFATMRRGKPAVESA